MSNGSVSNLDHLKADGHPTGVTAYIGLGSSLGDRMQHLQNAIERLQGDGVDLQIVAISPVYESPHLGLMPGDELRYPHHLNAVVQVQTSLSPSELLTRAQTAEAAGGRQRDVRWGPRTIDVDLLLYADLTVVTAKLALPHPGLEQRAFVVLPLHDLAPTLRLTGGTFVSALVQTEVIRRQKIELFGAKLRLP